MAIREGRWDCKACGKKAIRGSAKFCSACGSPRPQDVEFYLPPDAEAIDDEEIKRNALAGPDWDCEHCGSDNKALDKFCSACGAPRIERSEDLDQKVIYTDGRDDVKEESVKQKAKSGSLVKALAVVGGIAGAGILFCILAFSTETVEMKAASFSWQRNAVVEKFVTKRETKPEAEVPENARIISKKRGITGYKKVQTGSVTKERTVTKKVQKGTKKVKVGVKDLGNGYFEDVYEDKPVYEEVQEIEKYDEPVYKEEPVYGVLVTYDIDLYVFDRDENTSGNEKPAYWYSLKEEKKRFVKKSEKYLVTFVDDENEKFEKETSFEKWSKIELNEKYSVRVNKFFGKRTGIDEILLDGSK